MQTKNTVMKNLRILLVGAVLLPWSGGCGDDDGNADDGDGDGDSGNIEDPNCGNCGPRGVNTVLICESRLLGKRTFVSCNDPSSEEIDTHSLSLTRIVPTSTAC